MRLVLYLVGLVAAVSCFAQGASLAAAQKEGSLTLYTSFDVILRRSGQ